MDTPALGAGLNFLGTNRVILTDGSTKDSGTHGSQSHYKSCSLRTGLLKQVNRVISLDCFQEIPPPYNYTNIRVPVYLFWSKDDWMTTAEEIEHVILKMLRKEIVKVYTLSKKWK